MKKIVDLLSEDIKNAFVEKGYDEKFGVVTLSNRPDLCQYQCNGAMAAAKAYKKAPIMIAQEVVDLIKDNDKIKEVTAIMPGFININLSDDFIAEYIDEMRNSKDFGCEKEATPKKVIIDYGGPNIAKPLHVGHMRSAIIGESLKRIFKFMGNDAIGDVHLGDWGTPMGLVIAELKRRKPDLVYFDESYTGEYPSEAPFTISELEDIYPAASAYSKENPEFLEEAKHITLLMQNGHRGYMAIWNHMQDVSVVDLKKIYDNLNVSFELWKMESDAQPYITDMVDYLKKNDYAKISDGALVVDVKEEADTREIPPFMILKSDGATLYSTTDLATIVERVKLFDPDHIIYITDKRQELHFERLFRCAKKTKLVKEDMEFQFIGFGTMNGKDGKPFKTRDGGVLRLEHLIKMVTDEVYNKIMDNRNMEEEQARQVAAKVGLAALKYGDLSNQASKDYVFDLERFTSFEGNTGPYILYTIVRIKSIIDKFAETGKTINPEARILPASSPVERDLGLQITRFSDMIHLAYLEQAPHRICQYIYDLADKFSSFYHDTKIISDDYSEERQSSLILMITLVKEILLTCIDLLAFEAPERM